MCLKVLFVAQTHALFHLLLFFFNSDAVLESHASRVGLRMRSSGAQLLEREPGENGKKQFCIHAVRPVFFSFYLWVYRSGASLGEC